ncbi:hypothetical protein KUM39_26270 [Streptomyces sp. J2-1]|uniref:DUF6907 domain-containing protein n=1 Tax=Streptomyces corallincola TaxID=2851888 RepID=UPI001C388638|nr:hypothetical protein [Streptomyces corallincola]MBV2357820.1 hypothetical protein [Streptomyces corallincola]
MSWHTTRRGLTRPVMRVDAPLVRAAVRILPEPASDAPDADVMRGHDTVLRPVAVRRNSSCAYCKAPAVVVRTGQQGNEFGLCAKCVTFHDRSVAADALLRRVVVPLNDTPGATLTATCPAWCVSEHEQDAERGVHAADFTHWGPELELCATDGEPILTASLRWSPFASDNEPTVGTYPEFGPDGGEFTPQGVRALADRLREYADRLDELSMQLHDARGEVL